MAEASNQPENDSSVTADVATLVALGLNSEKSKDLVVAENWTVLGILGGIIVLLIGVGLIVAYCLHKYRWRDDTFNDPEYRNDAQFYNWQRYHSKGAFTRRVLPHGEEELPEQPPDPMMSGGEKWDIDDLSVQELLERMQYHHNTVKKSFEKDDENAQQILKDLHSEADKLRQMLNNAAITVADPEEANKLLRENLGKELVARDGFDGRMDHIETDLSKYLNLLYTYLEPGAVDIAHTVMDQMVDAHDHGKPEVSHTLDELSELLDGTIRFSDDAIKAVEGEKKRRAETPLRSPNDPAFLSKVNALREADEKLWPTMQNFINGLRVYLNSVKESPESLVEAEETLKEALNIEDPKEHDEKMHEVEDNTIEDIDVIDRAIHALLDAMGKTQEEMHQFQETELACRDALRRLLRELEQQLETKEDDATEKKGEDGSDLDKIEIGEDLDDLELQIEMQDETELKELNLRIESEHARQLAEELARQEADQAKMLEDAVAKGLSEEDALRMMAGLEEDNLEFEQALQKEQQRQHEKLKDKFIKRKQNKRNVLNKIRLMKKGKKKGGKMKKLSLEQEEELKNQLQALELENEEELTLAHEMMDTALSDAIQDLESAVKDDEDELRAQLKELQADTKPMTLKDEKMMQLDRL